MTLPRFLSRIGAATAPLMPSLDRTAIGEQLEHVVLALRIDDATAELDGQRIGYLHAVNLAARIYPHLIVDAPAPLHEEAAGVARAIHPHVDLADLESGATVELLWRPGSATATRVTVTCSGWMVQIDHDDAAPGATSGAVAMVAAAVGMGQIFRSVFAEELQTGRAEAVPWSLHLVTLTEDGPELPLPQHTNIGTVHLAGGGAIGEAAVAALAQLPLAGTIVAVDPEPVDLGNLQRYVLTTDADEGAEKSQLIARAFKNTDVDVVPVTTPWGDDERSGVGAETVLTALDSPRDRIAVQASLPRTIYNAWTQTDDIGVSRHEGFGNDPCLACVYWPRGKAPSHSERIARELGEHELRVLCYMAAKAPVGRPLAPQELNESLRLHKPADAPSWLERSLLDDVAERTGLDPAQLSDYRELTIEFLHRDGVCGELLRRAGESEGRDETVSVPLAHQSALAGALLALTFFIARSPELVAHRPTLTQARYDVLSSNPQQLPQPSTRRGHCLCHDPDFVEAYAERWTESG